MGLQQADADQPVVLVDPLDRVPVELDLAEDDGGEVDPTLRNSPRVTGCVPARRSRSSILSCWVSASAIDEIVARFSSRR